MRTGLLVIIWPIMVSWTLLLHAGTFNVGTVTEFQNALNSAASNGENDTINVAAGTYNISSTLTYSTAGAENFSLTINGTGATILDAGGSTQSLNLQTLEPNADLFIGSIVFQFGLSGSGGGLYAETDAATITIDLCFFDNNIATVLGGGACIVSNTGNLTVSNSVFMLNSSNDDAGGLNAGSTDGTVEMTGCSFEYNDALGDDAGGALLYAENGEISMTWNTFIGNTAADDGGGGFTYQLGSNMVATIANNSFYMNHAHLGGGGSFTRINDSGSITYTDNVFEDNSTSTGGGAGTFIYLNAGNLTYTRNTYTGNTSLEDGGGAWVWTGTGTMNLSYSTFTENSAANNGGGLTLLNDSGTTTFRRCVLDSNDAGNVGGGISYATTNGSLFLFHNTLYGNTANDGGGIYFYFDQSGALSDVYNNILWFDSPNGVAMSGATSTVLRYSDIENGGGEPWFGAGCIDADPLFEDPAAGDFHLTWTNFPVPDSTMSPCIDAGDPASPPDPDSTTADMGRYYFNQSTGISHERPEKIEHRIQVSIPNPSYKSVQISYSISRTSLVQMTIYNAAGQYVAKPIHGYKRAGTHRFTWHRESRSSGIYFMVLDVGNRRVLKKLIMLR